MTGGTDALLDELEALFEGAGAAAYAGERVTVAEHMLQCAVLAQDERASDALVAAALLHDIGHLVGERGEYRDGDLADWQHHETGADFLAPHFAPEIVGGVRLHVAAKRFLCGTEAGYMDRLSPASRHSLSLQGGPMGAGELAAFARRPFAREAVAVRRWDDAGKAWGTPLPPFAAFRPLLARSIAGRS